MRPTGEKVDAGEQKYEIKEDSIGEKKGRQNKEKEEKKLT
jgi:hypothetical protein